MWSIRQTICGLVGVPTDLTVLGTTKLKQGGLIHRLSKNGLIRLTPWAEKIAEPKVLIGDNLSSI